MKNRRKQFDMIGAIFGDVRIVENKLIIKHDVVRGYKVGELKFPGDDRDRIPIYKEEEIEFLLPNNHQLSLKFLSDYTIIYKVINGVNYFYKIDVDYENDLKNFQEGMNVYPSEWVGNQIFDINDYT